MRSLLGASLFGCLMLAGCLSPDAPRSQPAREAAKSQQPTGAEGVAASALASRVCALLQREPAARRAACCGSGGTRHFAAECERALSSALGRGALRIDGAAVQACSAASAMEQLGCAWVTPSQPLPPLACRALTQGRVAEGGSCQSSLECVAPLHCSGSTPSDAGHCAAPEPNGSACGSPTDALAAYLFAGELDGSHPTCAGSCSLLSRRCEAPSAAAGESARASGQALAGAACRSDFDCHAGGCNAGQCGMKCSVALPERRAPSALPALGFRRLASRAAGE